MSHGNGKSFAPCVKHLFAAVTVAVCFTAVLALSVAPAAGAVDALVTPKIDRTVITVGGADADIPGFTSHAIQIAIDAIRARETGGTVRLGAGTFDIIGPVRLASGIDLVGAGETTILRKGNGVRSNFVIDADYGMVKVTIENAADFRVGMGIQLYDDRMNGGYGVSTAVITSIDRNTLYLDRGFIWDYRSGPKGIVSNACSIVSGVDVENCRIADLVIDGNGSNNDLINGCVGGGLYLFRARNVTVEGVTVEYFNGDSFSWQITENITLRNCEARNGFLVGFHPGTGSDTSIIENCRSHHNGTDGIFLCWRVQNSILRNNELYANARHGLSIGHKDTDNVFIANRIHGNANHGVYFRNENEQNSGHRNTFRDNVIENNGSSGFKAFGFYIDGETYDILIENNTIRSTGSGNQTGAIFIGPKADRIVEKNNTISGHPGVSR